MAADAPAPAPDLNGFAEAAVRFAAQAWPLRAAEEDRSEGVFAALSEAATAVALPSPLVQRLTDARGDEAEHARLCTKVAQQLGAAAPRFDRGPLEPRFARVPQPLLRVLSLSAVEVAAGETVSCALFREAATRSREPLTKWALTNILRDEARHAQLGWECLAAALALPDAQAELEPLHLELQAAFASMEQLTAVPSLRMLEAGAPFDPALEGLGVLAPQVRVEAFYDAVEKRVLPRFDALGLRGADAWAARYRGPGAGPSWSPAQTPTA
jgi:hypothetical protein